jgi:long-subunit fatty acid transport protein
MKKLILSIIIAASVSGMSFAANTNLGTSTAQFLKLGAGARASGMGEAFVGVADDASAIYWNPAGLTKLERASLAVMHAMWLDDTSYEWASYAQPISGIGVFGLSAQYFSYGSLTTIDNNGVEGDSFTPADLAVSLAYARNIASFGLGVSAKYISSKIVHTATAYALDIGVQHKLGEKLTLGLAVQNMGSKMKFVNDEDALPMNIRIGGAYSIKDNWIAALDVNTPNDDDITFAGGTEYLWTLDNNMAVAGRLGYTTFTRQIDGLNGLSGGLGFTYKEYTIDYAFVPYGDLGNTQRISLSIKF